ncbi:MAG: CBS domain-containing protein, partial [Alphaproteobacteria bacterium]
FLTADPIIVPPDLSLHRMVEDYFYRYYFKAFPVVEGGRAIGIVSLDQVRQVARDQWETTTVGDVLTPVGDDNSVALGTPALAALRQMQRGGLSRLLVVERGRLAGLVCLRDLLGYLTMRLDLEGGDGGTDGAGRRQA